MDNTNKGSDFPNKFLQTILIVALQSGDFLPFINARFAAMPKTVHGGFGSLKKSSMGVLHGLIVNNPALKLLGLFPGGIEQKDTIKLATSDLCFMQRVHICFYLTFTSFFVVDENRHLELKGRVSVCSSRLNPVVLYGLGFDHHLLCDAKL
ncbi:hypothetical protein V8G54_025738 [Vigna mungo]|uniref:Uncharacterized protein n=1 Tax=Vigna mungo TaxID=3915 RepID=A0AAQ3MYV7_VIGMU